MLENIYGVLSQVCVAGRKGPPEYHSRQPPSIPVIFCQQLIRYILGRTKLSPWKTLHEISRYEYVVSCK
jgi:hypothetical protein